MSIAESLRQKVESAFSPEHLELENESSQHSRGGPETHFRLVIVSQNFEGLSRVERQRRVQALFEAERSAGLHALALWTHTPAEWSKLQEANFLTASPRCQSSSGQSQEN